MSASLPAKIMRFLLIFLTYAAFTKCDDILGCGGFVRSDLKQDFAGVEVKLYTKHGSLKDQTECAPTNGYYFLPVPGNGDYVLKLSPPAGWSFEPMQVSLKIDGETDQCSRGQDINFIFRGFSVFGKIISQGSDNGPEGVKVTLATKKTPDDVIAEKITGNGGTYSFSRVMPGEYVIRAHHPKWKFERTESILSVTKDNGVADTHLVVKGYDVSGAVVADDEPVSGVNFVLFAVKANPGQVEGCDPADVPGFRSPHGGKPVCSTKSGTDGRFTFPVLPSGTYKLVPFLKNQWIHFDISPSSLDFTVGHDSVELPTSFKVKGFGVKGHIKYSASGKGVPKAIVLVDGNEVAVTDSQGQYQLESIKTGTYTFDVKTDSDEVKFNSVHLKIAPTSPHLPDILASSFRVCGQVVEDVASTRGASAIIVEGQSGGELVDLDDNGLFCHFLPPGSYEVRVQVADADSRRSVRFSPSVRQIKIIDSPIDGITFSQFHAKVSGKVNCLTQCRELQVSITLLDEPSSKPIYTTTSTNGTFSFSDVLPGTYEASVHRDDFCWKERKHRFTVVASDVKDIQLEQVGYSLALASTHDTHIKYSLATGTSGNLAVARGASKHCLTSAGVYTLEPISCHIFTPKTATWDSSRPAPVQFVAVAHLFGGSIVVDEPAKDIGLTLRVENEEPVILKLDAPTKDGNSFVYKFEHHVKAGANVELVPSAEKFLFDPTVIQARGDSDCNLSAVRFVARRGKFLEGHVSPRLAGVKVTVTGGTDNLVTETDSKGEYKFGPLRPEQDYVVTAEKEGYVLQQGENGTFIAQKLGEVAVKVVDEDGQPLSGVLLTLSGGASYRQNSQTKSDGKMVFGSLGPGEYFLKPMMKEFRFNPPNQRLTVQEVETVHVELKGQRVAFSCIGTVTCLDGEGQGGVTLEAVGRGNCTHLQEEAVSEDGTGAFRIRGLIPQCEYDLHLKEGLDLNQNIEWLTPSNTTIKVLSQDVSGIRVHVLARIQNTDVTMIVDTSPEFLQTLTVSVYPDGVGGSSDSPIHVAKLEHSPYVILPSVPRDSRTYIVQVDSSLSRSAYLFDCPEVTFRAESTFVHLEVRFQPVPRASVEQELTRGSPLAIPLAIIIAVLAYFHQSVIVVLLQLWNGIKDAIAFPSAGGSRRASGGSVGPAGDNSSVEPRRKVKARKVF